MQDLSGGNVLLTTFAGNPHGFTAKIADFGTHLNHTLIPATLQTCTSAVNSQMLHVDARQGYRETHLASQPASSASADAVYRIRKLLVV